MRKTEQFAVKGMTCGNCVRHVEKALANIAGVSSVVVSLELAQATVEYDSATVPVNIMVNAVADAGYTLGGSPVVS